MEKVFHTILMTLDFIAAVPYICKGDVKMTVYWSRWSANACRNLAVRSL